MNPFLFGRTSVFAGGCLVMTSGLLCLAASPGKRTWPDRPGNPPQVSHHQIAADGPSTSHRQAFYAGRQPQRLALPASARPFNASSTLACGPPEGGATQNAANNGTYQWAGPTVSTVSVVMTTDINNVGEQVVVSETMSGNPAFSFANADNSKTFTEMTKLRWHKNGGHTGNGNSVNNYIGRVTLTFSNPVPANEIMILVMDMDTRGVDGTAPDGSITFTGGSQATPADFEPLTWTDAPSGASPSTYNTSDGSIAFGIGTNPPATGYNKYVALTGKNTDTVSEIRIFTRNVADDVGYYVGWLNPCPALPLPVTLKSFSVTAEADGNLLKWSTSSEENFDRFLIGRNADAGAEFGILAGMEGGKKEYTYLDRSPERGTSYYRLKMLDKDGTYQVSPVRSIDRQLEKSVYPNPTRDRIVYVDKETGIESGTLVSLSGKKYALTAAEENNRYRFQLDPGLPKGVYVLECLTKEGKLLRRKVVLD